MRDDPGRLGFEVEARDGAARSARMRTAHGVVETPAFIPLATRGAVRAVDFGRRRIESAMSSCSANTFHLFLSPGAGADRSARRLFTASSAGTGP